jgi:FkbM family methyltransferase
MILIGMLHETLLTNSTTTENREKEAHFEAHKVSGEACFGSPNDRVFNFVPKVGKFLNSRYLRVRGQGYGTATTKQEARQALAFFVPQEGELRILDVGANIGDYAAACLEISRNVRIKCFEPSHFTSEILRNRFANFGVVEVIELALGIEPGTRILYSDKVGSGMASLTKRRLDHHQISFSETEVVSVVTLDEWCQLNNFIPNLIKLDVEGHEFDVLIGGKEILGKVDLVQFEFGGCNIDTRTFFKIFGISFTPWILTYFA